MHYFKLILLFSFAFVSNLYAGEKINVFVSILPQQYFVEQIGHEYVDVHVMVGPGQNPATYEPTPKQMVALTNADVYFKIGVPFESAWLEKIKLNNEKLTIVECCASIATINDHSHEHNSDYDPHVWTSPKKVIKIAELIKYTLLDLDKENSELYEAATESFISRLQELDATVRVKTNKLKRRDLIVSHPSWSYFSDEYGFKQVSIEQQGKEIQASSMVKLIVLAKDKNIKAVFVQPQFNDRAAKVIASEIDADILMLDPLAFNYLENMNRVVDKIVKGLSDE
jgi:zinc transport system substrate-binding protein